MTQDRRSFIKNSSMAAVAASLPTSLSGVFLGASAHAADGFNIHSHLETYLNDIGLSASDIGGEVSFTGQDPILYSKLRLGACQAIPAMACGVGAAAIWKDRTGEGQDASVDLREAVWNINSFYKVWLAGDIAQGKVAKDDPLVKQTDFIPTINGGMMQAPFFVGNPVSFIVYKTKDDRPVTATGLYHSHLDNFLRIVGTPPDRAKIATAIKSWNAEDLEQACFENDAIFSIHRTAEEWAEHPQGQYLATVPLIEIEKIGDTDPIPFDENGDQPLSGIKTLAFTHVIAGTTAARTLAEYGSDVMHIARPQSFEFEFFVTEVNVGMRSTWLDIKKEQGQASIDNLLQDTDVVVQNVRNLANYGLDAESVARKKPGTVYLSHNCYGYGGPWAEHGGFDMEGCSVSGITATEGTAENPEYPPTGIINDFVLGYIGASGVMAALRRRAKEGGSYHVKVNLTRAAMWYSSLGLFETTDFDRSHPDHKMITPRTITGQTPYGEVHRLAPLVQLSKTPSRWKDPIVHVRGASLPEW
jgi:crotonobetainyl-CoA:carnitine CoA-transferase CaiB-like acyl-CoA transferase